MTWAERADSFATLLAIKDPQLEERTFKILSPATLALLYDNHWLVQKICNLPVDLGLKDGFHTSPAPDPATSEDPKAGETPPPEVPPPEAKTKTDAAVPVIVATKPDLTTGAAKANAPLGAGTGQGEVDPAQSPEPKADLDSDDGYQAFLKWNRTEYAPDGIAQKAFKLGRLQGGHAILVGTSKAPELEYAGEDVVWIDEAPRTLISVDTWEEDQNSPRFRQPVIFEVQAGHARGPLKIHFSKVIICPGLTVARHVDWKERHWTNSVLQPVLRSLCGYDNAMEGLTNALARFDVGVLKSAGLFAALDLLNKEEIDLRKQVFNDGIKSSRTIFLDPQKEEDYQRLPLDMSGLPESIQILKDDLSGAVSLPQTHLFGVSGDGLGASGKSQQDIVDDSVEAYKTNVMRPALEKLMSMIMQRPTRVTFEAPKAAPNDGNPGSEDTKNGSSGGVGPNVGKRPSPDGVRPEGIAAG